MDEFSKLNILEILAKDSGATWFTAHLLRLIYKADPGRREQLRRGFPEEVAALEQWERESCPPAPSTVDELAASLERHDPIQAESERQIILLALFKLKRERPGWAYAIGEIETKLGGQLPWPEPRED